METPIKMDGLGVPPLKETTILKQPQNGTFGHCSELSLGIFRETFTRVTLPKNWRIDTQNDGPWKRLSPNKNMAMAIVGTFQGTNIHIPPKGKRKIIDSFKCWLGKFEMLVSKRVSI